MSFDQKLRFYGSNGIENESMKNVGDSFLPQFLKLAQKLAN